MTLNDTVELMNSEDYKDRFLAEYMQTKIRCERLHKMLIKHEAGTLGFEPTSSIALLEEQEHRMNRYLWMLELRAEIEGIEL